MMKREYEKEYRYDETVQNILNMMWKRKSELSKELEAKEAEQDSMYVDIWNVIAKEKIKSKIEAYYEFGLALQNVFGVEVSR